MDDDSNDIFGLENMSGDEDESLSQHVVSDTESTSGITATTKQSNAITEITDMRDTKSMNPESVITDQDQEEFVEKNEILLQLYAMEASHTLQPMEYARKKCLLSSRFHPVKVESILAQCAKKKGVAYKVQRRDAISIAGMAKLYVRDLITKAKKFQDKDSKIISPDALRQAAREWRDENHSMFPSPVSNEQSDHL
ncbi:hypothetical protein WA588_004994 [Blastocystis sp. NMH]